MRGLHAKALALSVCEQLTWVQIIDLCQSRSHLWLGIRSVCRFARDGYRIGNQGRMCNHEIALVLPTVSGLKFVEADTDAISIACDST